MIADGAPGEAPRPRTWIPPPAPYAAALLSGWWLDRSVLPLPCEGGAATRALGGLLVGLGLVLLAGTLFALHQHRTTVHPYKAASALCTSGPFRISRNPIYLGDWFILAGACCCLRRSSGLHCALV
jgi:protein-S-isoprenylcysteine O-methyltransferase Ste14